jgi:hypothetical protein
MKTGQFRQMGSLPDCIGWQVHAKADLGRFRVWLAGNPSSITKFLTLPAKSFSRHIKSGPERIKFTLCLPGSPKVNAGGAYALAPQFLAGTSVNELE